MELVWYLLINLSFLQSDRITLWICTRRLIRIWLLEAFWAFHHRYSCCEPWEPTIHYWRWTYVLASSEPCDCLSRQLPTIVVLNANHDRYRVFPLPNFYHKYSNHHKPTLPMATRYLWRYLHGNHQFMVGWWIGTLRLPHSYPLGSQLQRLYNWCFTALIPQNSNVDHLAARDHRLPTSNYRHIQHIVWSSLHLQRLQICASQYHSNTTYHC